MITKGILKQYKKVKKRFILLPRSLKMYVMYVLYIYTLLQLSPNFYCRFKRRVTHYLSFQTKRSHGVFYSKS